MEEELAVLWKKMIFSVIFCGFVLLVGHVFNLVVVKPKRLREKLHIQGIRGPSPSFLLGNIPEMKRIQQSHSNKPKEGAAGGVAHDWPPSVFPYFEQWRNQYGNKFVYSTGNIQLLFITDLEIVKELSHYKSLDLGKPAFLTKDRGPLLGEGVLSSSGPTWAHQRKIIAPEFYLDKVKGMVKLMVDSTNSMLTSWENRINNEGGVAEIKVDEDLRKLSADIISRACFGSSFSQGKEIFFMLRTLQGLMSKNKLFIGVPGLRYVPSKTNRELWRLEKEIHSRILRVVEQRTKVKHENDLLQMILEGAKSYGDSETMPSSNIIKRDKFIVDNCKSIYFAGHETTATTATWCLMLLAANPDWQDRARAEIQEICGRGDDCRLPDANMLRSMKTLTMVIHETLRLYPPASFITRQTFQDLKFKDLLLPKDINIWIPVPIIHQEPDIWGPDAHQFNPERFANGILGACKSPQAYIPFGIGTRSCLGQNFATVELKAILSLILSNFCFSLSPTYEHSPAFNLVIEPGHGVDLIMKKV